MEQYQLFLFVLLFAAITAYGVFLLVRFFRLRMRCRIKTEGDVVEVKTHKIKRDGVSRREYSPVVRFRAQNGMEYTVEAAEKQRIRRSRTGSRISIAYDETDPECFYICGNVWGLLKGITFALFGGVFFVLMMCELFVW